MGRFDAGGPVVFALGEPSSVGLGFSGLCHDWSGDLLLLPLPSLSYQRREVVSLYEAVVLTGCELNCSFTFY